MQEISEQATMMWCTSNLTFSRQKEKVIILKGKSLAIEKADDI